MVNLYKITFLGGSTYLKKRPYKSMKIIISLTDHLQEFSYPSSQRKQNLTSIQNIERIIFLWIA